QGALDVSVVSAVEYARDSRRYLLLPDLAISCDGPVRSVMLYSTLPAPELSGERVLVSSSSMTSVALLELLFEHVWQARPEFIPGDSEHDANGSDARPARPPQLPRSQAPAARLVIGDAALTLTAQPSAAGGPYQFAYDLGAEWKRWTGLPFVFAVWVAQRSVAAANALAVHATLIESRDWGLAHLDDLAVEACARTRVPVAQCREYLSGLDYALSYEHLAGLTEFFRRLVHAGRVPNGTLAFLPG
ncbi:MAG: menaquinone biosynthetic enzyme MqnA/MqnD family protein, partial [Gemmatimonadaceae bacterium]